MTGHGTGVPVFQHSARGQDNRKLFIWNFVRRLNIGRDQFCAPVFSRKSIPKQNDFARLVFRRTRVGDTVFLFQPLPGNALDRSHCLAHFGVNILGTVVGPIEANPVCDFLEYPPVLTGVAGGVDHLTRHLNLSIGIGEGSGFLGERRRRQDNIGEVGGLGQENVLNDQMVEGRQRRPCMGCIRIRHCRVFSHDIHAID